MVPSIAAPRNIIPIIRTGMPLYPNKLWCFYSYDSSEIILLYVSYTMYIVMTITNINNIIVIKDDKLINFFDLSKDA